MQLSLFTTVSIAGTTAVALLFLPLAATCDPTLPFLAPTSLRFLNWTIRSNLKLKHLAVGDSRALFVIKSAFFYHLTDLLIPPSWGYPKVIQAPSYLLLTYWEFTSF